jgi:16S rRNA (uracil1498-N3)-methyltransferase
MTRRRFIADTWTPTTATLTGDQAAHLARVLRGAPGQIYDIVANGFLHRAEITEVIVGNNGDHLVQFTLHEELSAEAALPLHLLLAVFKFDHMEWAIEKSTELGIASITPILARRTEKHLAQSALKRSERWRRIALEASKQSRRTDIPEIADPIALKSALDQEKSPTRILLSETEQQSTLSAVLQASLSPTASEAASQSVAIAIGPEGGWTPEEMSLFTQHHWQPVTLGPRILRAETAAIAAIAIAATHFT